MSSKTAPSDTQGGSPINQSSRSTPTPNGKESTSPSNADVELKNMQSNAPKGSIPLGEDIMQLARIGEIGAMQNLLATKNLTANHRDAEGITPLHVRLLSLLSPFAFPIRPVIRFWVSRYQTLSAEKKKKKTYFADSDLNSGPR